VITGSLFFVSMQTAQAANEDRPRFREFRDANSGIDRNALRKMFHQQFSNAGKASEPARVDMLPVMPTPTAAADIVRVNGVTRRIEKRLERQGIINQSIQQVESNLVNVRHGVNLDLSSAARNITLGSNLFDNVSSVEISVGGDTKTVQAGSQVSAAEYIAVKQILSGNSQKITIGANGSATGGELDLGTITANNDVMRASDLVVPVNVTTHGDFGKGSDFKLLGDLTNSGTVNTYSSRNSIKGGAIRANDIVNNTGATINSEADLGLYASGNLSNYGTITSKGSLTLSAGNTLSNSGDVSSKDDLNLNAPNVVNAGSMSSLKGNINIDGPADAELLVNGSGGSFTAARDINVRAADYVGTSNTNVTGGDFFSNNLNLHTGGGVMQVHVDELTGTVTQTGTEAHLSASTDELTIGEVCLTGDPTYKNDAGNIIIAGNITVAEDLAIIASGNITSVNNVTIRAGAAGTGYNISLIAGADQIVAGTNSTTLPGGATAAATSLTGFASATGGSVILGNNNTVNSRSTTATGSGGNVLIAAFEGTSLGTGRVNVGQGTTSIVTGGMTGADSNGNVTIIAGAQNTVAANIGNINTTGGNTTTGQVNIITTQPISSNGAQIDFNANGAITSGNGVIAGPGLGVNANVTFVRNVVSNVDIFVDADTITTLTGSSVTSNFNTINFTSLNGIIGAGVGSLVSAPTVNLVSQNTDIGAIGARLRVDADNLYVDAPLGSVYVQDIDEVNLLAATVQGDFNILAQGTLTNSGQVAGDTITFRSSGGNINAINNIIGVSGVDLRASFNVESTAQITSPVISVRSDLANIGSVNPLVIDGDDLVVNAPNGNARLIDLNSINLGGGDSSVFGTLEVTADFGISNTSNITANIVTLTATNGVFTLGAVITGNTAINLTAGQSIQNIDLGGSLVSPSINLTSLLANIGTNDAIPLNLDVQNVTLNAINGNVWFSDPNSANLGAGASNALGDFFVTANNDLSSTGTVYGTDVELTATNGSLDLDGLVSGTNSITLTSLNSILNSSISGGLDNGFGGPVSNLTLYSLSDIGSTIDNLAVDSDNLTFSAGGSAYIIDPNAVTVAGPSSAGVDIQLTAATDLNVAATIAAGGSIEFDSNNFQNTQLVSTTLGSITVNALNNANIDGTLDSGADINVVAGGTLNTSALIDADEDVFLDSDGNMMTLATVNAGGDLTMLSDNGSVQAFTTVNAGGTITIDADTTVTTFGSVVSANGDVFITAENGDVSLIGLVSSGGDALIGAAAGSVTSQSTIYADGSVFIDADVNVTTNGSVTANTGDAFLTAGADVNLFSSVTAGIDVVAIAGGDVNAIDSLTGGVDVALGGTNVTTNGAVTAITGNVEILADNDVNAVGPLVAASDVFVLALNDITTNNITAGNSIDMYAVNNITTAGDLLSGGVVFMQADNLVNTQGVTGTDIDINGFNGVTTNGVITGDEIFITTDNGSVQLNDLVAAATSVNLTSYNDILNANIVGGITSPAINLTSLNGDIGASGDELVINTVDLTANAFSDVYITSTGSLNLADNGTGSSADGFFVIDVDGDITSTGTVEAVGLVQLFAGGAVTLGADVTATSGIGGVGILADGNINTINGAVVSAAVVSANSFNGSIGTDLANRFTVDSNVLSLFANNGSVFAQDQVSTEVNGVAAGTFAVRAAQDLGTSNTITAAEVILEATGGSLFLDDAIAGSTSITLISNGNIFDADVTGGLTSPQINLNSTGGDIVLTTVNFTNVTANAFGNVDLKDANGFNIGGGTSSAGVDFFAEALTGNLTSTGSISAVRVALAAIAAGGSLDLDGSVTASNIIILDSDATIANSNVTGGLNAPNISLQSLNGNIDITTVNFINVDAQSDTGYVNLVDTTGNMTLGTSLTIPSSAATTFTAIAPINLHADTTVTAGTTVTLTATAGSFLLNAQIDGSTINLTSGGSILNSTIVGGLTTAGGAVNQLNLISTSFDIGAAGPAGGLNIDAVNLTANAFGLVNINDTAGGVTVNGLSSSGAGADFTLTSTFFLDSTAGSTISGNVVSLFGSTGFDLDGQVVGTTQIILGTNGQIQDFSITGGLLSPSLNLSANAGIGTLADPLNIDTNTLTATSSAGGVYVIDANSLDLAGVSGLEVSIEAVDDLSSSGTVTGATGVILKATNGGFDLQGAVVSPSITLISNDSILNSSTTGGLSGPLAAPITNLILTSTAGDIGAIGDAYEFDTINLTANAPAGDVIVADNGSLGHNGLNIAGASGAQSLFIASSSGNFSSAATITADNVILNAPLGSFTLGGLVTGTTSITLFSDGTIANASVAGGLNSPLIQLTSNNNITLTTIDFTNLVASAVAVSITDPNAINIGPSDADTTFVVNASGNISSTGAIIAGTSISLTSTFGAFNLGAQLNAPTVNLSSNASILDGNITGGITSANINLTSTAGSITTTTVDYTNVTANAANSINLTDAAGSMTFGPGGSTAGLSFTALAPVNLSSTGGITSTAGTVTLTAQTGSFDLDGLVRGANGITLSSAGSILNSSVTGGLEGSGGAAVPQLILTSTAGDIGANLDAVVIDADNLVAIAPAGSVYVADLNAVSLAGGVSGALNVFYLSSATDISVEVAVQASELALVATNDLVLDANVTGTTSLLLEAGSDITQTSGTVLGGALTVDFGAPAVTLNTNVASVSSTTGTALTINEVDDIEILSQAVSTLTVSAGGDIFTGAALTVATLDFDTAGGDIVINNNITSSTSVTLDTSAGLGSILQLSGTLITTPVLNMFAGTGGIGNFSTPMIFSGTGAGAITVTAQATGGNVHLRYTGTNTVSLGSSTGNSGYTLAALNGSITTLGDIDGDGMLNLTTSQITHANEFDFDTIVVSAPASGLNLVINGGAGGDWNSANGTTMTTLEGNMTFNGSTTFGGTGEAELSVVDLGGTNNFFTVNGGASVVGLNKLTVNACDLVLTGTLQGNPLVVNCADAGTIANNNGTGDVNLTGNIVFNGGSFAILASGNINMGSANLINLTGTNNGGNLTLMAGFTFTPATAGQTQNSDLYTITGTSTQGGNVNFGGVNILTVGNNGNGGSVTVVASGGLTNAGTVALGSIDTSGTATSGQVRVIASGGITVGDIDTTGGITSGNVNLAVANPTISGTIFVQDGVLSGGSFVQGTTTDGNISINNITAPGRDVTLTGARALANTVTQGLGTTISTNRLFLNTGLGTVTLNNTAVAELNTTGGGEINLNNEADSIAITGATGAGQQLFVSAAGTVTVQGAGISGISELGLVGNNSGNNAIVINAATSAGDILLTTSAGNIAFNSAVTATNALQVSSAGTITQGAGVLSANQFSVGFATGPVTLSTNVTSLQTTTPGTLTINEANDITLGSQSATALTVVSATGDIFTNFNFTVNDLTLTATNGLISVTNDIIATNSATLTGFDGMTTSAGGSVTTNNAVLSSTNTIGTSAASRFDIVANSMRVAAAANAFVNNTLGGAVTLGNSTATQTLDLVSTGNLVGAGTVNAANVVLATGGQFALTGAISGTTSVTLRADGNILNADVTGAITTPTLTLTSVNGSVGVDENTRFVVGAGVANISGNALSPTGSVFINSDRTNGVNFLASSAGNDLFLSADGALTITGNLNSDNGDLAVDGTGGFFTVADGVSITAFRSISLVNTTSNKKDKLILGANSTIATDAKIAGLGDVLISIGPSVLPPTGNKIPKNVTVVENGGTVTFAGKKAKGFSPQNTFTAQGADVLVSNNLKNNLIEIRGNVNVTADPPVPVGTPVYVSYGKGSVVPATATMTATGTTGDALSVSNLPTFSDTFGALPLASTNTMQLHTLDNAFSSVDGNVSSSFSNLATVSQNGLSKGGRLVDNSFITTNAPSTTSYDVKVCGDSDLGFAAEGKHVPQSECVTMDSGSILFVAAKDMTVVAPKGTVKLAAGAVALVVADADHLSVYDVNDHHKRSVTVETGGRSIPLSPGRHVTVTHEKVAQFAEINAVETMMHRNVGHHELGNGRKAFTTEFSLPSAFETIKPLKAMIQSDNAEAQKLTQKVIKTSAVLLQLSAGGAPYEFHAKPRTVALNW